MEDQEREYLEENMRRLEAWENTPPSPSGRWSDMTGLEKDKLLDLLFNNNERLMSELSGLREAMDRQSGEMVKANAAASLWQQRAIAAEQRAEKESVDRQMLQVKIDELLTLVRDLQNGEELKAALTRAEKAEKELSDLQASDRNMRRQIYVSRSQKSRKNKDGDNEGQSGRDSGQEKESMGGKDTVGRLPESTPNETGPETDVWVECTYRSKRAYREGKKNRTMQAAHRCVHRSDISAIPEGWTLVREEKRFAYDKTTVIVEHEYNYFIVRDPEGKEQVMYCPLDKGEEKWFEACGGEMKESQPLSPVQDTLVDSAGNPVMDRFPGTLASSGMLAQVAVDHFVNNIAYYRLADYFRDNGMSVCRQTLINWMDKGGRMLGRLIPRLLDTAVEKDSVINCDETWCKVRVQGKYRKKYIWCLVNRELKTVIYFYRKGSRSRDALKSILEGRLPKSIQTDGYNVYLYLDDVLIDTEHLCCMAHARAKFYYAWLATHDRDAEYILDIIRELYVLEEHYERSRLSPEDIRERRNGEHASELVIRLRSKIDAMKSPGHPPRTELLEKALRYIDDFWDQLFAYRKDGRYTIDNNIAERFMRPVANERKNSLFYGSDRMAEVAAVYRTLISTCRLMKVSVSEYFTKVFRAIVTGCDNLTSLLPMNMGLKVNNY